MRSQITPDLYQTSTSLPACHLSHLHPTIQTEPNRPHPNSKPNRTTEPPNNRQPPNRLRREGRVRELLSLGRKGFAPQLLSYLSSYPSLLWLAQAAGSQWSDAAATLLVAAQAVQVGGCGVMVVLQFNRLCLDQLANQTDTPPHPQDSCPTRRTLMSLAKLAAHAASPSLDAWDARHPYRPLGHQPSGKGHQPSGPQRDSEGQRDSVKRRAEGELQALAAQEALGLGDRPRGADELVAVVSACGEGGTIRPGSYPGSYASV